MTPRLLPVLALALAATVAAAEPKELLPNGDFEDGGKTPTGWSWKDWGTDAENRYVHLVAAPAAAVRASRTVPLAKVRAAEFAVRCRHSGLPDAGDGARIDLVFRDAAGKEVLPGPLAPAFTGTIPGWQQRRVRFFVPAGAVELVVSPVLDHVAAGSLDLDDLRLTPLNPADVLPEERYLGRVGADAGGKPPAAIHAQGNRLLDEAGAPVRLQGVALPALQDPKAAAPLAAIALASELWHANAVRLDLDRAAWAAEGYRAQVDQAVLAAASRSVWIMLELDGTRAPVAADAACWAEIAARYKDSPAVVFALFRRPHDLSWEAWQKGGQLTAQRSGGALAEDAQPLAAGASVGMQALVDAIRGAGARNLIVAAGIDWGYELAGAPTLDDHGGRGIAYGTALHPWQRGWQEHVLAAAAKVPVVVTDLGCARERPAAIPAERYEDPFTWAPDALACVQGNGLHWFAGTLAADAPTPLVRERFAPTSWWGGFVRAALTGAVFTSERRR